MGTSKARNVAPNTLTATPILITQSLSTLCLKHAHLLREHHADSAAPSQRKAEVADAQACEVDACATGDALLQATRAAEDHMIRAEHTAALAEQEVRFPKALNVCSPLDCLVSLSSLRD